ncbi:ankyrin repeat-containing protein ITN1-like isoform X1 [Rhododendron vialii]|uniref:ankyrin repeat-containing protein ITN1-like isoform X1 n=1 Tax=Rhododendron vialii TaxID=182163 RepID=UPI00265F3F24|nr:ankyrin repeat-containing protein ITN1-like isoform X1 [Rhododendron vialii]XP_058193011.1 ankyrin repeat-containing protein ITN1-like isoform X1 [Rhododendron vialii]XP_058193012.1 ankyrin repeat-containing protein ITN1-like isoform X1 [Rhododendron vialii]XP_058193013.1 ankyrin repeat-containing protein ITN1-like isoform X1 [Rhododendron vialii]XP_058193015.1 ankyrin repeat-containing protein ITN1-like isoform X1 [Rhododendron vialii]XP_058193016.1 ankyrin repeat-containing protein ITN1-l
MEREDMGRRLYQACLSGSVPALDALIEEDQLILDRVSSLTCFSDDTPLHVAALRGHLDFTKALLARKPKLATELDSLRCSPLHLASAEGHVEIVRELLRVNTDVCIARDQDGRIPLHLAVMKGRVEVILELLRAEPESIHEKLSRGETVLHLCVKYNRQEAFKTLVQYLHSNHMEFLLNAGDDNGNTILHLAAALKQKDNIEYLLGIKSVKDHTNVKNKNGSTALDVIEHCPNRDLKTMEIREFLLQIGVRRSVCSEPEPNAESPPNNPHPQRCCNWFWNKYIKVDNEWLQEVRGHLITAATLTATMAYQSILSPPGGLWQETKRCQNAASLALPPSSGYSDLISDDHICIAGQAIMDNDGTLYTTYMVSNTVMLIASLGTIMLAMTGFPSTLNKHLTWLMVITVFITIYCMAVSYQSAMALVSPNIWSKFYFLIIISVLGILCVFFLVLQSCRFLVWQWKKLVKLVKACYHCCGPTPRAAHNITTHDQVNPAAGSHKCIGNFC